MRVINFRGWHATKARYFSAAEMARDQLSLLPTGQFVNVSGTDTRLSYVFDRDQFAPEQSTGLRDKHGCEVYDGDIINVTFREGAVERFDVVWNDASARWSLRDIGGNLYGMNTGACSASEREIIGNVHEGVAKRPNEIAT